MIVENYDDVSDEQDKMMTMMIIIRTMMGLILMDVMIAVMLILIKMILMYELL